LAIGVHLFNDLYIRPVDKIIEYQYISTNAKKVGAEQQYGNDLFQEQLILLVTKG
jgi:hypothetical protein